MSLTRTLDSESEVLSLSDAKTHLRITGTDDDDALRVFIAGIRHKVEKYLGKTLITSTWVKTFDSFAEVLFLPMHPIQSITSVEYVDTNGSPQTLASNQYQFDGQGRLSAAYGVTYPSTREQFDAVTVTYIAGKTHAGNVEFDIKLAMLMWIGSHDVGREDAIIGTIASSMPDGAKSLLATHRDLKL